VVEIVDGVLKYGDYDGQVVDEGVVNGRFQGLHAGHVSGLILPALARCRFLFIGVNQYNPAEMVAPKNEKHAEATHYRRDANPFSLNERRGMIMAAMDHEGVPPSMYHVTPFPIEKPHLISDFVPKEATFFGTIFEDNEDGHGNHKFNTLRELGFDVDIFAEGSDSEREVSGSMIRDLMVRKGNWQELLHPGAAKYAWEHRLDKKLRTLFYIEEMKATRLEREGEEQKKRLQTLVAEASANLDTEHTTPSLPAQSKPVFKSSQFIDGVLDISSLART